MTDVSKPGDRPDREERASASAERRRRAEFIWPSNAPTVAGLPAVIRGGWAGFVVLFFGDLITLIVGRGSGLVLYWVAAAGYAIAGNRAAASSVGAVRRAARDGALAAAFAYALTIPLRSAAGDDVTLLYTAVAIGAALIVGALAAVIAARGRQAVQESGPKAVINAELAAGAVVAGATNRARKLARAKRRKRRR